MLKEFLAGNIDGSWELWSTYFFITHYRNCLITVRALKSFLKYDFNEFWLEVGTNGLCKPTDAALVLFIWDCLILLQTNTAILHQLKLWSPWKPFKSAWKASEKWFIQINLTYCSCANAQKQTGLKKKKQLSHKWLFYYDSKYFHWPVTQTTPCFRFQLLLLYGCFYVSK